RSQTRWRGTLNVCSPVSSMLVSPRPAAVDPETAAARHRTPGSVANYADSAAHGLPSVEDVAIVRKGKLRQRVRREPPDRVEIVARDRLAALGVGHVDGEDDRLSRRRVEAEQRPEGDFEPDLLPRLADRRV